MAAINWFAGLATLVLLVIAVRVTTAAPPLASEECKLKALATLSAVPLSEDSKWARALEKARSFYPKVEEEEEREGEGAFEVREGFAEAMASLGADLPECVPVLSGFTVELIRGAPCFAKTPANMRALARESKRVGDLMERYYICAYAMGIMTRLDELKRAH